MKPNIGQKAPSLEIGVVDREDYKLENTNPSKFSLIIFYRGLHCPVCKNYLQELDKLMDSYKKLGIDDIVAVSGDTFEKAKAATQKWDLKNISVGHGLTEDNMREWGLYLSRSIKDDEPAVFSEPGLFLVDRDKNIHYVAINSMPFGRPDLKAFHESMEFVIENNYPARGKYHDYGQRENKNGVDDLFIQRWSPRAFESEFKLNKEAINKVLSAARWAPSCFNEQPWEFKVSLRQNDDFDDYLGLLEEFNQSWAKNASAIVFIIGRKKFEKNGKENYTYQFDCGAAWMSLTHQANLLGLKTHGMGGISRDQALKYFKLKESEHDVICGFALGREASKDILPDKLREQEELTQRNDINDFVNLS